MTDFLTKAERSARMSRIRGSDTGPERVVFDLLRREGVRFARHARQLPGKPDVVFRPCRLAVFIDGDFWHGRRLPTWKSGLKPYWLEKIQRNVRRDRRTRDRLRSLGWHVVRIWGTDIGRDPERCVRRLLDARTHLLRAARKRPVGPRSSARGIA